MKRVIGISVAVIAFLLFSVIAYATTIFVSDDPVILYNSLGNYYFKLGDSSKAKEFFEKALTLDPNNAKASHNLGVIYYVQKDLASAKHYFEQAILFDANYEKAHYSMALVLIDESDLENALTHLQKVAQINPKNVNAQFDLAVVHVELFRKKEISDQLLSSDLELLIKGIEHYNTVLALNENFPDARSNRDIVMQVLKDYEQQIMQQ